ncbi:MAG TPA: response regulator [Polyangiaceae bacterium]|nr:response regulator [Polyangiaceae bacterium]
MKPLIQWSGRHRILIADDEPDIHAITRLSLKPLSRKLGPTEFVSAASGKETLALLEQYPDIGVILLDVVMETDTAGLDVCRRIRQDLGNHLVRILLRTGQPGVAPEQQTIDSYDIDGYLAKTETSSSRLYTAVRCALKSYQELLNLERHAAYLAAAHDCAMSLGADTEIEVMLESILQTVLSICPAPLAMLELETFEHGDGPRHLQVYHSAQGATDQTRFAAEAARVRVQRALAAGAPPLPALLENGFFVPLSLHRELGHGWLFVEGITPDEPARQALTLLAGHAQNAVYSSLALRASRERKGLVFEAANI